MDVLAEYHRRAAGILQDICQSQPAALLAGARLAARALSEDKLIYIFGCGHSHMLAEEGFYRAGGLAAVCPVFDEELMLHKGAVRSSRLEKQPGLAGPLLERYPVQPGDVLICVSTSGVNSVPLEMAQAARAKGMAVVGIASGAYLPQAAGAPGGRHLSELCDVWVNNCVPHGDACLRLPGLPAATGPLSTIAGAFILNALLAQAQELAAQAGTVPAVYRSGNIPGGAESNQALIRRYAGRIRHL